jgi:hypothetical protein
MDAQQSKRWAASICATMPSVLPLGEDGYRTSWSMRWPMLQAHTAWGARGHKSLLALDNLQGHYAKSLCVCVCYSDPVTPDAVNRSTRAN